MSLPGSISLLARLKSAPGGTSPVGTLGISSTQIAYGSGANQIKGGSNLTFIEGTNTISIGGPTTPATLTVTSGVPILYAGTSSANIYLGSGTTGKFLVGINDVATPLLPATSWYGGFNGQ